MSLGLPARADNRKSCNLNGERLSCSGVTFVRHVSVTPVEWYCYDAADKKTDQEDPCFIYLGGN